MLLSLWHYLKGYVIVEVHGASSEKFLNLVTYHGMDLWNIQRHEEGICFCTSIQNFKSMKQDAHKTKCRLRIKYKKGLPFVTYRYKKRKLFVIGIALFMMMIWLLSSFVWLVEVEGNQRINSLDVIHTLEANGYGSGKLKSTMNLRMAEAIILREYPDVIWVGIDYEGTRLIVRLSESVLPPHMNEQGTTSYSIVAKRDALITYIAVEKGKPMVKVGDIVKKGDMLVSGKMPLGEENESLYYTVAKADVRGKTVYSVTQTIQKRQVKKAYNDEVSKHYRLKFFDKTIPLFNTRKIEGTYDTFHTLHQLRLTKFFPLPFAVEVQSQVGYEPTYYTLSNEEAKDALLSSMWKHTSQYLDEKAKVLKREAFFKEEPHQIAGRLYVIAEESIGYPVETNRELQNEGAMSNE